MIKTKVKNYVGVKMNSKFAKIISVITVVPIYALIICLTLFFSTNGVFGGSGLWLFLTLLSIGIIPALAYPISYIVPKIKAKGRDGQRKLAFIMGLVGFLTGLVFVLTLNPPKGVSFILVTYALSGFVLAFFNKVIHIKASGHSCGVTAPSCFLIFFLGLPSIPILLVLPIVYYSRLKMGRHTLSQLIWGSVVSLVSMAISYLIFYVIL